MRIAVTGSIGLLGGAMRRVMETGGRRFDAVFFTRRDFDITDRDTTIRAVAKVKPDVLINLAACTGVDRSESEPEGAWAANATGAGNVAEACAAAGARLVHMSTDYVFDGGKGSPYAEDDPPSPTGAYAVSKAGGEREVLQKAPDVLLIRSAWLFGHDGPNFVSTIIAKGRELGELRVVNDQIGSPTYADDLAAAIVELIGIGARGIVHVANFGYCSWHGLAVEALKLAGLDGVRVEPVTSEQYKTAARRPKDSRLDTSLYARLTGAPLRGWKDALAEFIRREKAAGKF